MHSRTSYEMTMYWYSLIQMNLEKYTLVAAGIKRDCG